MIKGQLVRLLADRARVEPSQVAAMVEALADLAVERLSVGSRISIDGLGTLEVVELSVPIAAAPPNEPTPADVPAAGPRAARRVATSPPDSATSKGARLATKRPAKDEPRTELASARARPSATRAMAPGGEAAVGCLHDVVEGLIAAARGEKRTTKRGW